MSQASSTATPLYLAGQVAGDEPTTKAQTEAVFEEIDALLAAAGTSKSNLLSATVYLADMKTYDQMNSAWDAWVDPSTRRARHRRGEARGAEVPRRDRGRRGDLRRAASPARWPSSPGGGTLKETTSGATRGGGGPLCGIDAFFNNARILGDVSRSRSIPRRRSTA